MHVNYDTKTIFEGSISAVHAYFEGIQKSPIPVKILWTLGNINPFFLAFNLVSFIVSKIKKNLKDGKLLNVIIEMKFMNK